MMLLLLEGAHVEIRAKNSLQNSVGRSGLARRLVGSVINQGDRAGTEGRDEVRSLDWDDQAGVVRGVAGGASKPCMHVLQTLCDTNPVEDSGFSVVLIIPDRQGRIALYSYHNFELTQIVFLSVLRDSTCARRPVLPKLRETNRFPNNLKLQSIPGNAPLPRLYGRGFLSSS